MKRSTNLIIASCIVLAFVGHAAAQQVSLASLPAGTKFTKYGFTIALPAEPTETTPIDKPDEQGKILTWYMNEGMVEVRFGEYTDGTAVKTEADRRRFLDGFKNTFVKNKSVESMTEAPYAIGRFSGLTFSMLFAGHRMQTTVLIAGNKYFGFTALAADEAATFDSAIFKAAKTFDLAAGTK